MFSSQHVRSNVSQWRRLIAPALSTIASVALACACGGAEGDMEGLAFDPAEGSFEEFDAIDQDLSEGSCATVVADKVLDGTAPHNEMSPNTYNTCGKSWVLDIDNIRRDEFGPQQAVCAGAGARGVFAQWAAAAPTTQADCLASEVSGYLYQWDKNTHTYVSVGAKKTAFGQWNVQGAPGCTPPSVVWYDRASLTDVKFTEGGEYRVAATARAPDGSVRAFKIGSSKGTGCIF